MSEETTEEPSPDRAEDSFDELPDESHDELPRELPGEPTDELTHELTHAPEGAAVSPAHAARPRPRRMPSPPVRRMVWGPRTRVAVASLALVAMMFLFVFPTRSYLAQKRQIGKAAHAVKVLEAQNEVLARQASQLKTRSEIERLAREQFNMVLPGEQAYNVVETHVNPTDTTTTTVP
jgi:cell division protein FtsB